MKQVSDAATGLDKDADLLDRYALHWGTQRPIIVLRERELVEDRTVEQRADDLASAAEILLRAITVTKNAETEAKKFGYKTVHHMFTNASIVVSMPSNGDGDVRGYIDFPLQFFCQLLGDAQLRAFADGHSKWVKIVKEHRGEIQAYY